MSSYIYDQLTSTREPRQFNGERAVISKNGRGTRGYPQTKKEVGISTSHHVPKLTQK